MGALTPGEGPDAASRSRATDGGAVTGLRVATEPDAAALRVTVAGEIDIATADQLREAVQAALAQLTTQEPARGVGGAHTTPPRTVYVDLDAVSFLDAVGVGVLVECAHAARQAGGQLSVRNPRGIVARVLAVTGAGGMLRVDAPEAFATASS